MFSQLGFHLSQLNRTSGPTPHIFPLSTRLKHPQTDWLNWSSDPQAHGCHRIPGGYRLVRPAYNSTPANTTPKYIGSRVFPSEALRMARTLKGMLGVRLRTSHEARAALTGIYWRISAHKASRRQLGLLYSTSYSGATREDTR